ncbi:MAG: amino acid carrier protein [Bacilli bacterium]
MLKIIDSILWAIATCLIVYCGIYYTFKLKFVQFRFIKMFKNLFKKKQTKGSISPFNSLMIVLGGRIGVGSIAGIALAIHLGGIGSIFWLWLSGILSAPNTFAETVLGVKYKEYDEKNIYKGGPSYYIKKGLNKPLLGKIYAIVMLISYVGGCLSIQANTITKSINPYFKVSPIVIGIIISLISFLIIAGGIKKISSASAKIVPIMTLLYVSVAIFVVIKNFNILPYIFIQIVKEAFNFKALGFGIFGNMIIGIQRGIFSNEAGLGTGAIAASTVDVHFPAQQGFVQMLGIYITTFFVCTATAIIILTSNIPMTDGMINGIEMTQQAFIYHLGSLGNIVVIISIILFAFSTILAGYYDGESNLKYLFPSINKKGLFLLKIISIIILLIGCLASPTILWQFVNIFTALLAIINIYALIKLKKDVIFELRRYRKCAKIK